MSVGLVEREVAAFLASKEPEVLCLRGKWGVGKTFAWKKFLSDAKERDKIALGSYAYVSLFGLNSLEQLKYSIFENSISKPDIGIVPSLDTLQTNTTAVAKQLGRNAVRFLQYIPGLKDVGEGLQSAAFLSIRNRIICIDDLERKGDGLSTKDVLGLISHLREEKSCKVVLILNEEELQNKDKDEFDLYQEKVIDVSLVFAPTAEECGRIALSESSDIDKLISARSVALGISNIRIIRKIGRLVMQIQPLLSVFDPKVFHQAVQTITLLG